MHILAGLLKPKNWNPYIFPVHSFGLLLGVFVYIAIYGNNCDYLLMLNTFDSLHIKEIIQMMIKQFKQNLKPPIVSNLTLRPG